MTQSVKIQVVYSEDELLHNPVMELTNGDWKPYVESPERLKSIKAFVDKSPLFELVQSFDYSIQPILDVHRVDYVEFLRTIYDDWVDAGLPKTACLGDTFVNRSSSHLEDTIVRTNANKSCAGKMGYYLGDMSVSFVKDTWKSIYASAQVVLSAAHRLANTSESVYALCRPPGHHASHGTAAGYCFVNNVAVATRFLQNYTPKDMDNIKRPYKSDICILDSVSNRPSTTSIKKRILILDIDYHHGNGTQSIFYDDPSVLYISLHGYPDYPHFTGSAQERGKGAGVGYNINIPLNPSTTTDAIYLQHLDNVMNEPRVIQFDAQIVIVSMGLDTWHEDPIAGLKGLQDLETYNKMGFLIKSSKSTRHRPVLFVQEGGYTIDKLGELAGRVLQGYLSLDNK